MKLRYKVSLFIILFLILACVTIYQSYAMWQINKETGTNIAEVTCFQLSFDEASSSINLTNTYPMSDSSALGRLRPYTFTIKNTCTTNANYAVTLNTITTNGIADDEIKYALYTDTKPQEGTLLTTAHINTDTTYINVGSNTLKNSYELVTGTLAKATTENGNDGGSVTYNLLLWMDEASTTMSETFRASVNVISTGEIKSVYKDGTGASVPELATGMIPIYYDGTTMKVADRSQKWYNYADHEWANAVLVDTSNSTIKSKYFDDDMTLKTSAIGQTVNMNEVQQMYVWIPRYRYQLWNAEDGSSDPQAINIVFEDKNTTKSAGTSNGDWLTHPAFTFGTAELNGIWVGKFENSRDTSNITIKPNMASIASTNVSTMFNATRAVESSSLLGLISNEIDSHMMKDTEWGAVAYLYSSIYGTYNADKTCIARGCEVWINNVSSNGAWNGTKYTGCAAQGVSTGAITGTSCESGRGWDGAGVNASTTGNMYGIYDMSGGNFEYTMSVMLQSDGTPQIQDSGFTSMPDSKYYNTYPYGTSYTDHARGTIGTATKETLKTVGNAYGGWNEDYSVLVNSSYAWSQRGGHAGNTTAVGVFAFNNNIGGASACVGFRVVLALAA